MRLTQSHASFLHAIIALIFVTASFSADDLRGADHTMPAFIDLEYTEQRVDEASATVVINIIRSGDFRQTTTINFQTSEIEASEGQDYKGAGGTITFEPGQGYKTVVLEIIRDSEAEQPESFRFDVSPAGPNCIVSRASAVIWIDDTALAI